jgi:hypothetical protein
LISVVTNILLSTSSLNSLLKMDSYILFQQTNEQIPSGELSRSNSQEPVRERKPQDRVKKKTPWYSALYPTYKSRSEDFKRIFKDVPADERLIVGQCLLIVV